MKKYKEEDNLNRLSNRRNDTSSFYEYLKELEKREAKKRQERPWDNVTVSLHKDEIKRINLVFALLRAHGVADSYTSERWMRDVIGKALRDLEDYLWHIDGINVCRAYADLREVEERQKERQKKFFQGGHHEM